MQTGEYEKGKAGQGVHENLGRLFVYLFISEKKRTLHISGRLIV